MRVSSPSQRDVALDLISLVVWENWHLQDQSQNLNWNQNSACYNIVHKVLFSAFKFDMISLNYIKQNRLKGTLHWTPLFLKKKFQSDEYDIPLVRAGHWREPHVFSFLICAFVFKLWFQTWSEILGLEKQHFCEMMQFLGILRTGEAVQGSI